MAFAGPKKAIASRAGWEETGSDREARSRRCRDGNGVRKRRVLVIPRERCASETRVPSRKPDRAAAETNTPSNVSAACRFADDG